MELLVYANPDDPVCEHLYKDFKNIPGLCMTFCSPSEDFAEALKNSRSGRSMIIFSVSAEKDIRNLLSLKEYLWDVHLILILPNRDEKLRKMGYALYPRLILFPDMQADILKRVISGFSGIS
ncbi:MAG: hypothetical protein V2I97_13810 [Desulfococcaceae bacterium]|jgi:hypothetical protein|nr:hypothetical protein [Desulfococcaceae bacterium]